MWLAIISDERAEIIPSALINGNAPEKFPYRYLNFIALCRHQRKMFELSSLLCHNSVNLFACGISFRRLNSGKN